MVNGGAQEFISGLNLRPKMPENGSIRVLSCNPGPCRRKRKLIRSFERDGAFRNEHTKSQLPCRPGTVPGASCRMQLGHHVTEAASIGATAKICLVLHRPGARPRQFDFAFDGVVQIGTLSGQNGANLKLPGSGMHFAHDTLNFLLRGDAYLL
jgi:hypothetical protein